MQHKAQITEHLAGFLQIPSPQRLSWAARIDTDLVTPARDADFDQLHVAAMALGRAIHITDIQTHQTQVIDTLCPWLPTHAVIVVTKYRHIVVTKSYGPITKMPPLLVLLADIIGQLCLLLRLLLVHAAPPGNVPPSLTL